MKKENQINLTPSLLSCDIVSFLIFLLFLVYSRGAYSQPNDYISYYNYIEKAYEVGVFEHNSDSVIFYMNKAIGFADPLPEDLFVMSKAFNSKGMREKSFFVLLESVQKGLDSTMLSDVSKTFRLSINQTQQLKNEYVSYECKIDVSLYFKLDSVIKKDQLTRRNLLKFDKGSLVFDSLRQLMYKQDSLNRVWLFNTMINKGFPGRKKIGNDRKSFVLLLHIKKPWIDDNFELIKRQIMNGFLNPSYLAATIDRYSFFKEGIMYGSFLPGNIAFNDNETMKLRRKKIGALGNKVFVERSRIKVREWEPKN